ncbi:hypothetical protein C2845_PM15G04420 [Panicum miliaceum]|uniref:Uncharacterized protein n=1 Tax=Panicum miliaceum TaxID=4540 RepID=A0A3L6Q8D6_PANMI|nr:hypothetical protein C2845_PM15G04420 [Panicum miliaceum]
MKAIIGILKDRQAMESLFIEAVTTTPRPARSHRTDLKAMRFTANPGEAQTPTNLFNKPKVVVLVKAMFTHTQFSERREPLMDSNEDQSCSLETGKGSHVNLQLLATPPLALTMTGCRRLLSCSSSSDAASKESRVWNLLLRRVLRRARLCPSRFQQ